MNNQEAIVHFEDKDLTASEWLKLVCDRSPLAAVLVRATGDQRYAASAIRHEDDRSDEDCQHCGRPFGDEVEIHQGKDRAIVYLHPECEAAYREYWGDKIIVSSKEEPDIPVPSDDIRVFSVATAVTPRGSSEITKKEP